jgi:hypothetical protein
VSLKINGLTTHVDVAKQDCLFKGNIIHSMIYKLKEKKHLWAVPLGTTSRNGKINNINNINGPFLLNVFRIIIVSPMFINCMPKCMALIFLNKKS